MDPSTPICVPHKRREGMHVGRHSGVRVHVCVYVSEDKRENDVPCNKGRQSVSFLSAERLEFKWQFRERGGGRGRGGGGWGVSGSRAGGGW